MLRNIERENIRELHVQTLGKNTNFIALKLQSYCFKTQNQGNEVKKSKGTVKHEGRSQLGYGTHDDTLKAVAAPQ